MKKDSFHINKAYRDTGKYKSCLEDEFGSSLFSGAKSITNQGGVRRKYFEHFDPITPSGLRIPAFIILVSTWDNVPIGSGVKKPWIDILNFPNLIYYGDNKPCLSKLQQSITKKEGCRNLLAAEEIMNEKKKSKLVPPILYFTKRKSGYVNFEGLYEIESLLTYDIGMGCENIKAKLISYGKSVNLSKLRERPLVSCYDELEKKEDYALKELFV
jgi:hypothetical protein